VGDLLREEVTAVSYINIRKAPLRNRPEDAPELDGDALTNEADHSFTDGEDIAACVRILRLLDDLDNGEALVITRDLF
jgi:hypothetical protein